MEDKKPETKTPDIFDTTLTDITRNYVHQAPVELPNQEQLKVRLVNITLIEKLIESKSDYEMYLTILFTMIGTLLGSILTILSSDTENILTKHFIGFITLIIITIVFLSIRLFILRKRYLNVKKDIFDGYE